MRQYDRRLTEQSSLRTWLIQWRNQLLTRRCFLLHLAGGSVAALFPWSATAATNTTSVVNLSARWQVLEAVQQHMFPSERNAPGAREIGALAYLQFVVGDTSLDAEERDFILQGALWLEDMAQQLTHSSFLALSAEQREQVLRQIERSEAGKNWLSLLLLYLIEALLADPIYGGNPQGIGWQWLNHIPGFPTPPANKRSRELQQR